MLTALRIAALRQQITRIERGRRTDAATPVLPFGIAAIDRRLPGGGLALGALHEVSGVGPDEEDGAVPAAFVAGLCARLDPSKPVLWCQSGDDLYGPGLAAVGLGPARLIVARPRSEIDLLWAMEEGLRTRALAAVVGEIADLPGPASRRLQLAAEASGVTAFALRRVRTVPAKYRNVRTNPIDIENAVKNSETDAICPVEMPISTEKIPINTRVKPISRPPNAAVTRWNITSLPSLPAPDEPGLGWPRWRLELWRARGAAPAEWIVEACDATGHVALPAALGDGTARGEQRRSIG